MYDHTAERVAYLMHAERLAQAPRKRLAAEAEAANRMSAEQVTRILLIVRSPWAIIYCGTKNSSADDCGAGTARLKLYNCNR